MALHRDRLPGLDRQPLDLKALAHIQTVITTPRAEYLTMLHHLRAPAKRQLLHHLAQCLRMLAVADKHRIAGFNHHQIPHLGGHQQPRFGMQITVLSAEGQRIAAPHIARRIRFAELMQRAPTAHIRPVRFKRHHGHLSGFFHQPVVNGY